MTGRDPRYHDAHDTVDSLPPKFASEEEVAQGKPRMFRKPYKYRHLERRLRDVVDEA